MKLPRKPKLIAVTVTHGHMITATATIGPAGSTSEFSFAIMANNAPVAVNDAVGATGNHDAAIRIIHQLSVGVDATDGRNASAPDLASLAGLLIDSDGDGLDVGDITKIGNSFGT